MVAIREFLGTDFMNISPFKIFFRLSAALAAMLILVACSEGTTTTGLDRGGGNAVVDQPAQGNNSPANSRGAALVSANVANDTSCFTRYVQSYSDLNSAYQSGGASQSMADWGVGHYLANGRAEGRTLPAGCKAPSSGARAVNSASAKPALSPDDYQLLYRMNAAANNGRTVRWPSRTIGVNRSDAEARAAVSRWKGFNFRFGTSGINFQGDSQARQSCGWSRTAWRANGQIAWCHIWINSAAHQRRQCGTIASTITHEVGHCLGIQGHTADGGLMDATAAGADVITGQASRALTALYSLPAGSPVSTTARASSADQPSSANTGLIIGPIIDYHGPHSH
jgi:hypothetical protein